MGIDLGVGSIKIVSLSKDGDKVVLDNIGEVKTPQFNKLSEVSRVLKSLVSEMKLSNCQAVVSKIGRAHV